MSNPTSLSSLSDPTSLAKLQILVIPLKLSSSSSPLLSEATYEHWSSLIRRHQTIRSDELRRPSPESSSSASSFSTHARRHVPSARFFPTSSGTSASRAPSSTTMHLSYPSHPPARHLYPLSLLRMTIFPLVVIGVAVDPGELSPVEGYSVDEEEAEVTGDIGQASAPIASTSTQEPVQPPSSPTETFDNALQNLFPPTSPFPLVRRLVLVPSQTPSSTPKPSPAKNGRGEQQDQAGDAGKGKMLDKQTVYAPTEGVEGWVRKMMGEVVGDVLVELGELATALETPAGLKILSSTLLPSLTSTLPHPSVDNLLPSASSTSNTNFPSRSGSGTPSSSLHHSHSVDALNGMGISLTRALTPGGRPTSAGPSSLPPLQTATIASTTSAGPSSSTSSSSNPFRRSTALSSPFARSPSAASLSSTTSGSTLPPLQTSRTKYTSASLMGVAGGRLLKLLGDMYLLAGMYGDAIRCFEDGVERCRGVGDVLWEAVLREGRAVACIGDAWEGRDGSNMFKPYPASPTPTEIVSHFLSALACLSRAPLPYPPEILSPSPQAASGSFSLPEPSSTNPAAVGTGEGLLAYLYTGLCLRISHFVFLVWAAGGWGSRALSAIMTHSLPRAFPLPLSVEDAGHASARRSRQRSLAQLSSRSQLARHSVFGYAEPALGPHHRAMTKTEELNLYVEMTWLARWLDLPRKEAYCTRIVVKRVGVMIVEGREENRRLGGVVVPTRPSKTKESAAIEAASVGLGLGTAVAASQAVAFRRKESTDGNVAVMALFERACSVMGIGLLPSQAPADQAPSAPRFGWPELQVEMMKEGIAVAEALPDHRSIIRFCTSALRSLHMYLNGSSQAHLAKMFPRALSTIRRRGMEFSGVGWWLPRRIALSMEIGSLAANRMPVEHVRTEIIAKNGTKDPFLYNPRSKAAEAGKTLLVANEQVDIFVTLQNPFAFDLDIQDLSLLTSGVPFITSPLSLSLPASSIQTVRVTGIAANPGVIQMRGVSLRLSDGSFAQIPLPVIGEKDKQRQHKSRSRLTSELSKTKRLGLEARFPAPVEPPDEQPESWLECMVVEEQPLLWIKNTSLTHGTVMLYNGESSTIRIALENSPSVPVDFLKLSLEDAAARSAQHLIAEGELSPEQAYELEWDVANRPVFIWENQGETRIPAGGRATLSVRCLGKVGCTDGVIRIDYGLINRDGGVSTSLHTRQITFPVLFTVYHTLQSHTLDLVRLVSSSQKPSSNGLHLPMSNGHSSSSTTPRYNSFDPAVQDQFLRQLAKENNDTHCLLGLNVRNVYGVPFEVTLIRAEEIDEEFSASRLVPPGATEQIIIPIPRRSLPESILSQPIPSISERQYVVDKSKRPAAQLQAERELFWYRDDMLKSLSLTWLEPGSRRSGTLSLRDLPLSPDLLDSLRLNDLDISLVVRPRNSKIVRATDFADIVVILVNRLERPIRPYVRLEPLPSSSSDSSWTSPTTVPRRPISTQPIAPRRNLAFDGTLARTLPLLQPGAEANHTVGVLFLASGNYSFRAAVEEVDLAATSEDPPNIRFSPILHVDVSS